MIRPSYPGLRAGSTDKEYYIKLLIATQNKDKLTEIAHILSGSGIELLSSAEFPHMHDVVEDRDSIEGNAAKKALETATVTGMICLADDTGLFIDVLDGAPGVYSARYAGEACSYLDNRIKVLNELDGVSNRKAEFRTAVALAAPDGMVSIQFGRVPGSITTSQQGEGGFGYDSIFLPDSSDKTYAQMSDVEKNELSHRALALRAMLPVLIKLKEQMDKIQ